MDPGQASRPKAGPGMTTAAPPHRPASSGRPSPSDRPASAGLDFATALVRAWTRAYTWRLHPAVRDTRRAEIESDLWEFQQDPDHGTHPAAHVLARLLIGMPDDLSWRAEYAVARRSRIRTGVRFAAWTVATVIVAVALWILPLMSPGTLPPVPDMPRVVIKAPPPPPPPPPPCAPAGFPQSRPCTP
jgi:hypothetical protein